jgi:hypothetical protein
MISAKSLFRIMVANKAFRYRDFVKSAITVKLFTCLVTSYLKYKMLLMFGNKTTKMLLVAKITIKDM